jgi:putative ATP-dependent endonuclease of OLD family
MRLRSLADRLGIEDKDFASIRTKAGSELRGLILAASWGTVPEDKKPERKQYQAHSQIWFKTVAGGCELAEKVFSLGAWSALKPQLMPFCNALRKAVGLPEIADLAK